MIYRFVAAAVAALMLGPVASQQPVSWAPCPPETYFTGYPPTDTASGNGSDAEPLCEPCVDSMPACAPCEQRICPANMTLAGRYCHLIEAVEGKMVCNGDDMFNAESRMCLEVYPYPAEASGCPEPYRPLHGSDGRVQCVREYPARFVASCRQGFVLEYSADGEPYCFTLKQAECVSVEKASVSPRPEEPSESPRPEEPSSSPQPEEPSESPRPEEPSSSPHPEKPSESPRPEEPSSSPHPEKPSESPHPEKPSESPRPEKPSESPRPEEPSSSPRPEEPSSSPHPEKPSPSPQPATPCAHPYCLDPMQLSSDGLCRDTKPVGRYPICEHISHTFMESYNRCVEWTMEPLTDGRCAAGFQVIAVQGTSICGKLYEPARQPCPPEYRQVGEMCVLQAPPRCDCPSLGNYTGCASPRDFFDATESMCYTWFEFTKEMRSCPQNYILVPRNDRLFCAMPYPPVEAPCPPGFGVAIRPDGVKICQTIAGERCDPEAVLPAESSSATPQPEKPSETPRPVEPSKSSSPSLRPVPTATATATTRLRPSASSSATQPRAGESRSATPTPCLNPLHPRCSKPNSIFGLVGPADAVSPSPAPSRPPPIPPPPAFTRKPLPSPEPPTAAELAIPPEEIPESIISQISFPAADPVEFEAPAKLQEAQAAIACALKLSLESVVLESILIRTIATGAVQRLPIDPMQYHMAAAESGCYEPVVGNTAATSRRLQVAPATAVEVEYRILNPPVKILLMNMSEFSSTLSSAPSLQAFAQSVGSSSLEASVVAPPPPAAAPVTAAQQGGLPSYAPGAIGGGAAAAVVIIAFVASAFYAKRKKAAAKAAVTQKRVVTFEESAGAAAGTAPAAAGAITFGRAQQSVRMVFNPINAGGSQGGFTD